MTPRRETQIEYRAKDENYPLDPKTLDPPRVATSKKAALATAHNRATGAGLEILKKGGNVFDAAVAAAFALCVCEPAAAGLGGQTMMLIHDAKTRKKYAVDGSSKAPNRTVPGALSKQAWLRGYKATTVPSTPAVLSYVLKHFGTKSLKQVLTPSIEIAEEGYQITPLQHSLMKRELKHLRKGSAGRFYLKEGKVPYPVGALFKQPALAKTLKRLADKGIKEFYRGKIASIIHRDMEKHGGILRNDDLAQIPWPVLRRPISCRFGKSRVFTLPSPGAGRTLIEVLNILNEFPDKSRSLDAPKGALLFLKAIRQANRDRKDQPIDPNQYPQNTREKMVKPERARKIAKKLKQDLEAKGETTHLSVMDKEGNAVALTQSIERVFGSFEASEELGFIYNNYMSAFEYEDMNHPYYLRPNASPWASVAPTLFFKGSKPWLTIGSPGSERIVSAVAQVILRLENQSPFDAVAAPRYHCSVKGKVSLEASRVRDDIIDVIKTHGYEVDEREAFAFYLGCVQLVLREKGGSLVAVGDLRRDSAAGGIKE